MNSPIYISKDIASKYVGIHSPSVYLLLGKKDTKSMILKISLKIRVAEVALMREGPSPNSLDSDKNFKP